MPTEKVFWFALAVLTTALITGGGVIVPLWFPRTKDASVRAVLGILISAVAFSCWMASTHGQPFTYARSAQLLLYAGVALWAIIVGQLWVSLKRTRADFDAWRRQWKTDQDLTEDAVSVRNLELIFDSSNPGPYLRVSLDVAKQKNDRVSIRDVCVVWVRDNNSKMLIPNTLCVLASDRDDISEASQVAGTFELSHPITGQNNSGDAFISFAYTVNGFKWKHWGKPVVATLTFKP